MAKNAAQKVVDALRRGDKLYRDGLHWVGHLTSPTGGIKRRVNGDTMDELTTKNMIVPLPDAPSKRARVRKWYGLPTE